MHIILDSKNIQINDTFVAIQGSKYHGLDFVNLAIKNGAKKIISDKEFKTSIPVIVDKNLKSNLYKMANDFYPLAKTRKIIAITGTNGKTSIASFISQVLTKLEVKNQVIGTLTGKNTTPDIFTLYKNLHNFDGITILEVSSHALIQERIKGLNFEIAVFSNLSQDHLDYHKTMDNYLQAKLLICKQAKFGIFNQDTAVYSQFAKALTHDSYSIKDIEFSAKEFGFWCKIDNTIFNLNLLGEFNLSNTLACYKVLLKMNYNKLDILKNISTLQSPIGRMQKIKDHNIWVDFAHSPDGLKSALTALKQHYPHNKITVVFGCGGDRDTDKRHKMGKVANDLADRIILTNDNPRSENPQNIIDSIMNGINKEVQVILDRKLAIEAGISDMQEEDRDEECVLIAGKGHENYQIIQSEILEFSDIDTINSLLN